MAGVAADSHEAARFQLSPPGVASQIEPSIARRTVQSCPKLVDAPLSLKQLMLGVGHDPELRAFWNEFVRSNSDSGLVVPAMTRVELVSRSASESTYAAASAPDMDDVLRYAGRANMVRYNREKRRFEMHVPNDVNLDDSSDRFVFRTCWHVMADPEELFGLPACVLDGTRTKARKNGMSGTPIPTAGRTRSGCSYGEAGQLEEICSDFMHQGDSSGPRIQNGIFPSDLCCVGTALLLSGTVRPNLEQELATKIASRHAEVAAVTAATCKPLVQKYVGHSKPLNCEFDSSILSHYHIRRCAFRVAGCAFFFWCFAWCGVTAAHAIVMAGSC